MSHTWVYHYRMNETIFKDAMSQIPTNVAVVGSWEIGKIRACTISSLVSVDILDPTIMFVLKNGSATLANIKSSLDFSVNVLSSQQANLSLMYSNLSSEDEIIESKKFWNTNFTQVPMIIDAHLNYLCVFTSSQELKNSTIVFAKVIQTFKGISGDPLVYFERKYFGLRKLV